MSEKEIKTITLQKPFHDHSGELVTQLNLKEPDAGVLRRIKGDINKDVFDMTCQYVEICGGLPKSLVNKISGLDLMQEVMPAFMSFFENSQKTGETSAET